VGELSGAFITETDYEKGSIDFVLLVIICEGYMFFATGMLLRGESNLSS
jgi:hypothetical protein